MVRVNPVYNAICVGIIFSALDKIGVSLPLVARQASELLAPNLNDLLRLIDMEPPKNLEDVKKIIRDALKYIGEAENEEEKVMVEINFSDNALSMDVVNCMYLDMANFGKSLGYGACPMCITAVLLSALINALKAGTTSEVKVENNGNECYIKITFL